MSLAALKQQWIRVAPTTHQHDPNTSANAADADDLAREVHVAEFGHNPQLASTTSTSFVSVRVLSRVGAFMSAASARAAPELHPAGEAAVVDVAG